MDGPIDCYRLLCRSWQVVCQDTFTQYLNGRVIHIDEAYADVEYILCETFRMDDPGVGVDGQG